MFTKADARSETRLAAEADGLGFLMPLDYFANEEICGRDACK